MSEQAATAWAIALHRDLVLHDGSAPLREEFCRTAANVLMEVGSWLAFDSFLGGGDMRWDEGGGPSPHPDRYRAFRATATVVMMGSELVSGALLSFEAGLVYAGAAALRQVLEVEYLLTSFDVDFSMAAKWAEARPEDIRRGFSPAAMRQVGGFSNAEYWEHCGFGGHPTPTGRRLLGRLFSPVEDDDYLEKAMWADFALHVYRVWSRTDSILCKYHARYENVRSADRAKVAAVRAPWEAADLLARNVDPQLLDEIARNLGRE